MSNRIRDRAQHRPGRSHLTADTRFVLAVRPVLATITALATVLALSACGGSSTPSSSATSNGQQSSSGGGPVVSGPGGTVSIRSIDDLDTFDPAKTGAPNTAVQAIELTYDRLLYINPSGRIEPYLATSWTTTPTSATFTIRKGPTCSDGTPVTAGVVASSLKYDVAKSTAAPYLQYLTGPGAIKSITANTTDNTVTVALTKPYNALLPALSIPFLTPIICPSGVSDPKSLSAAPAGSGPYVYDPGASQRGSTYVFVLRNNYDWGPEGWTARRDGVPRKVVVRVVTDETTAANEFLTGQVDIAPVYGINEPRVAANRSAYTFTTQSLQMGSWGVVFNQASGRPGSDLAVRHAVYLALNSGAMVKAAFSNLGVAFNTQLTPQMQCYSRALGSATPPFSPFQARRILEHDGYKLVGGVMTKNGKPLQLKIVMWNSTNQLGDYMQQALRGMGISSTVENTDVNTWITTLFTTRNYDLTVYAYYAAWPIPSLFPIQDASIGIKDPPYFNLSQAAEEAPQGSECAAWDRALTRALVNYDVKPMGVSRNVWFGKGWKFAAPYNVVVDPFTIQQTR